MGCVIMHYLKSYASNSLGAGRGTHDGLVLGEELGKGREPGWGLDMGLCPHIIQTHLS
jgi:hypothetical protein